MKISFKNLCCTKKKIILLNVCTSTNIITINLIHQIKKVIKKYIFIINSISQIKGYGRNKKRWVSYPGALLVSIAIIKISILYIKNIYLITLISIIYKFNAKNIYIKWPNDIIILNKKRKQILYYKKIAGILIENIIYLNLFNTIIGLGFNIQKPNIKINNILRKKISIFNTIYNLNKNIFIYEIFKYLNKYLNFIKYNILKKLKLIILNKKSLILNKKIHILIIAKNIKQKYIVIKLLVNNHILVKSYKNEIMVFTTCKIINIYSIN